MSDLFTLSIKPVIHYPRIAQVGKTYAMTIDLQTDEDFEWNYEQEEYPIHCVVNSDCFKCKPVGAAAVVLHRFGGNYGNAKFYLTATKEIGQGDIKVVLINAWGITIQSFFLDQVEILSKTSVSRDFDVLERILTEVTPLPISYNVGDMDSSEIYSSSVEAQLEHSLPTNPGVILESPLEEHLAVGSDEPVTQKPTITPSFFAYDEDWVGRESLVKSLSDRIRGNCRLLILVGMTGIGKTALGERLSLEVADWFDNDWSHYHQENFDEEYQNSDFVSVAARWLEKWGELIIPNDRKDPQRILYRTVRFLCEHRYLVQIDSLQEILKGNAEDGWSEFKDKWWLKFFDKYLNAETCQSSILLTSQDLPGQLEEIGTRSQTFWHCELLSGLKTDEQLALFEKTQLDIMPQSANRAYLERIGKSYEGHPLALRMIAGEIKNRPFLGNVLAYWNRYGSEVEEVEQSIAQADAGNIVGADDQWRLDRFTKALQKNMKTRLDTTFKRLREEAQWAYVLLCETSVYRCPVPENFWLSHLEDWERDENEQIIALEILRERLLIEESINNDNHILLRQSNLIRSVALEHLKNLDGKELANAIPRGEGASILAKIGLTDSISSFSSRAEKGHYRAVINWLTNYTPKQSASNLEKVQGYMEAFTHLCVVKNWAAAEAVVFLDVGDFQEPLLDQLGIWGYYTTQISMAKQVSSGQLSYEANARVQNCLGVAHHVLNEYDRSIDYYRQSLNMASETQNIEGVANALGNLGNVYYSLGDYSQAIEHLQQQLSISRQLENKLGIANALGNLGNVYYSLGDYSQAIEHLQQQLSISRQLENKLGIANALGNLGMNFLQLRDFESSLEHLQLSIRIFERLGNQVSIADVLKSMSIVYIGLNNFESALVCCNRVIDMAGEISIPNFLEDCERIKSNIQSQTREIMALVYPDGKVTSLDNVNQSF